MFSASLSPSAARIGRGLKTGLWPVMLTPFRPDGAIDWPALDELTDWYLDQGSAGLFACCLSSEMYDLTPDERVELVGRIVRRAEGRAQIVTAGAFGADLDETIELAERLAGTGAAAVVFTTNQFGSAEAGETALRRGLEAVLARTDLALGLYECPVPYKLLLGTETLRWAAGTGRFLYFKDTCCNAEQLVRRSAAVAGSSLGLFNAHTPTALVSLRAGAAGLSPIGANAFPELYARLCQPDLPPEAAERLQARLVLIDALIRNNYPGTVKRLLQRRGLSLTDRCRLPQNPAHPDDAAWQDALLRLTAE